MDSPGNMSQVKWDVALYLDSRATPAQRDALTQIFSGQAGGHPAVLASFIGRVLGIKSAVIDYQASGSKRSVKIGDIAEAEVEAIQGQNQQQATISNNPLAVAPGYPAVVGKSLRFNFQDYGLQWQLSGKNAFYSPFTYSGA